MKMGRVVLGAAVLILAACSGTDVAERIIESQEGVGNIEIDENSGSVVIEDEEGDVSAVIGGGALPADFPVPVPDGGDVMAVVTSGADTSASINYPSSEFNAIRDFYENWASSTGELLNSFESSSPEAAAWTVQDGDTAYNVSVANTGSDVAVSIVVATTGG